MMSEIELTLVNHDFRTVSEVHVNEKMARFEHVGVYMGTMRIVM